MPLLCSVILLLLFVQSFVGRTDAVLASQKKLLAEIHEEGAKFGDDIKYLADFTGGQKKFEPWIALAEAKKASGMTKPGNLKEALELLANTEVIKTISWKWKDSF